METPSKSDILQEFCPILNIVAAFERIDLQAGVIFLLQVFLCYKVWTSSLWKKLSGDHRRDKQFSVWGFYFFVTDFSESTFHLPGERDRVLPKTSLFDLG